MDELDSKLRNLEELEAARAKEAWEKHVVSTNLVMINMPKRENQLISKIVLYSLCIV